MKQEERYRPSADDKNPRLEARLKHAQQIMREVFPEWGNFPLVLYQDLLLGKCNIIPLNDREFGNFYSIFDKIIARCYGENGHVKRALEDGQSWPEFVRQEVEPLIKCVYSLEHPHRVYIEERSQQR